MAEVPKEIGKYPVLRLLGQGAMGKVYLGEDPFIGRRVAIKVLSSEGDEDARRRFLEEARTIGQLSHPNIVTLLEFGFHEGSPFLVMELLKGESLEVWLARTHPLPELLRVLRDLCLAVAHAHHEGVLHRDIKPSNAQVLHDGTCKLMDFGIARSQRMKLTATGMVVGTPQFIAPEVLRDASYTSASDTYAVGLVAYQALTGYNPFAAGNLEACLTKVLTLDPPPVASLRGDLSSELAAQIDLCLAKDPTRRPAIGKLLQSFERALAASGIYAAGGWIADTAMATYALPKSTTGDLVPATSARSRLLARLAAAIVVAAVLLLAGIFFTSSRQKTGSPEATPKAAATRPGPAATVPVPLAPSDQEMPRAPGKESPREERPAPPPEARPGKALAGPATANEKAKATTPPAIAFSGPVAEKPAASVAAPVVEPASISQPASVPAGDIQLVQPTATNPSTRSAPLPPQDLSGKPASAVAPVSPLPVLRSVSPTVVRRGSSASLELIGEGLGPATRVQISRGRGVATGIEIRKIRQTGEGRLLISLFVDGNVQLGFCSVHLIDAEGRLSNGLSLEVGL